LNPKVASEVDIIPTKFFHDYLRLHLIGGIFSFFNTQVYGTLVGSLVTVISDTAIYPGSTKPLNAFDTS
jgi:hypothetical protein